MSRRSLLVALVALTGCAPPIVRADGTTARDAAPADVVAAPPDVVAAPPDVVAAPPDVVAAPPDAVAAPSDVVAAPSDAVAVTPEPKVVAGPVSGQYALTWDEWWSFTLTIDGVAQTRRAHRSGRIAFPVPGGSPIVVEPGPLCDRPDIRCPDELLPARVNVIVNDAFVGVRSVSWVFGGEPGFPGCSVINGVADWTGSRFQGAFPNGFTGSASCAPSASSGWSARFAYGVGRDAIGLDEGRVRVTVLGRCFGQPPPAEVTLGIEAAFTARRVGSLVTVAGCR